METLHAFAAGDLGREAASSIEAAVASCAECRRALEQARSLRTLMGTMGPSPLDDLRWARLGRRIQAELRAPVRTPPKLDLGRWLAPFFVVAGTSLATAIVVLAWPGRSAPTVVALAEPAPLAPIADATPMAPPAPSIDPSPSPYPDLTGALLEASDEPFDLQLKGGVNLGLSPRSEVRVLASSSDRVVVQVLRGKLDVKTVADQGPVVELRAPDLRATARGASFSVALVAGAPAVLQVQSGDVRVVRSEPARRAASPVPTPAAVIAPAQTEPSAAPRKAADPVDPWTAAQRAYQEGRLDAAIEASRAILDAGAHGEEARRALSLICDSQMALDRPREAAQACEALLPHVSGGEARLVRFRIASIYRARLQECARAIPHYDAMIVVGSTAMIDHDGLLGRAECALSVGDLDMAARDLGFLGQQSLVRPDAYRVLAERLRAARARAKESGR